MSVEDKMSAQLKRIFDLKKVTFDEPGESMEQDCLFVEVENADSRVKSKRLISRVTGQGTIYSRASQIPIGFFSKQIDRAQSADVKDFFFFDFEENTKLIQDIVQRTFRFVYFFQGEYDPEVGEITELTQNIEVNQ